MNTAFPPTLILHGKTFAHVSTRDHTPVAVYRASDSYLRIGSPETLNREIALQKELLALGFPIASILSEWKNEYGVYYEEESLGEEVMGRQWRAKWPIVSDADFANLVSIAKVFVAAQIRAASQLLLPSRDFYDGIHVPYLYAEKPEWRSDIDAVVEKISHRLSLFPTTLLHGDFNAHNLFPHGVIDVDAGFQWPLGYDQITALINLFWFSEDSRHESVRSYSFSPEQRQTYLAEMDTLFASAGLPVLSEYVDDFLMARSIWTVVRMHNFPVVQSWRYIRFRTMMTRYLDSEEVASWHFDH